MPKRIEPSDKLVSACLDLAEDGGWQAVTPAAAAQRSGLSLPAVYDLARDRYALLTLIGRWVDRSVLTRIDADEADSVRDRLFDILMTRCDVLNERRDAFVNLLYGIPTSPVIALRSVPRLETSMRWMLDAAGLNPTGLSGAATVRGLTAVWLGVLRVWAQDDSADMAKTMAALDRRLEQAERWAVSVTPRLKRIDDALGGFCARRRPSSTPAREE